MTNELLNDAEFKIRVLNELTKLDSKVERLSSHLESEVGNAERATGRLEKALEVMASSVKEENEKLHTYITGIHSDIFVGNGKPSLSTRLDRIEQSENKRSKHIQIIWVTIITIFATIGAEWLFNRNANQSHYEPTQISQPYRPTEKVPTYDNSTK